MFAVLVTRGERSCYRRLISSLTVCLSTYLASIAWGIVRDWVLWEFGIARKCVSVLLALASDLVIMSLWSIGILRYCAWAKCMCDVIHAFLCAAEALCKSVFVFSWCVLSIVKVCLFLHSQSAVFTQNSCPLCVNIAGVRRNNCFVWTLHFIDIIM